MPSFTYINSVPDLDELSRLGSHLHQLTSASIIGNWQLDSQNTSIAFSLDLCRVALQLCNCPAILSPPADPAFRYESFLHAIGMAVADVLFLPWPHWAQLSFVLGGLMVIVLCLASAMKFRNWRKVLRFERWTAIEQVERGETIQRIQLNKDIPFGIKALEEEPAIEGVWNARTVTPLHTPPGSRGSSPRLGPSRLWLKDKRGSSVSSISGLDMEVPAQVSTLPIPTSAPRDPRHDPLPLPTMKRKKANSITISYAGPSTSIKAEYRCALCETDPDNLLMSEESEKSRPKLRLQTPPRRARSLRRRFVIGGGSSPHNAHTSLQQENQSAIDRMNAHRRLHSAECGQLLPRPRRHTTEISDSTEKGSASDEDASPLRNLSWPKRDNSVRLSQKLPQKAEKHMSPPVVSQKASVETPQLSSAPPSAWTSRTGELMKGKLGENRLPEADTFSTLPSMTSSTTLSTVTAPIQMVSIMNKQTRRINNGFELLPAGTFDRDPSFKVLSLWPATVADRPSAKRKPSKLQKRSRSDSISSGSSFGSQKSENPGSENIRVSQSVC